MVLSALALAPLVSSAVADGGGHQPAANRTTESRFEVLDASRPPLLNGSPARSIDGSQNNPDHPDWGRAGEMLRRAAAAAYADGVSAPSGDDRPGPREVSNAILAQSGLVEEASGLTDVFWLWGQFLDHDISLTEVAHPLESWPIAVPAGDLWFDPDSVGTREMPFERSAWHPASGLGSSNPRQQINIVSTWIDGSQVYGSDPVRASALRRNDGSGKLKTSDGDRLPFNEAGLPNGGGTGSDLFLAGDVRVNENVLLMAMHTIFVREHNRQATQIAQEAPSLSGDAIYEEARARVGALIQIITYREFLPRLLGEDAIAPYTGYDKTVDPAVASVFSTVAFRLGHSMVSPELKRLNSIMLPIEDGPLPLRDAFFDPAAIQYPGAIAELMRGAAGNRMQRLDRFIIDDLRNFLFGPPGSGGFDLTALNIQRARDHGLPDYNRVRAAYGLTPASSFSDITDDSALVSDLAALYATPDHIDPWVGAMVEPRMDGSMTGPLLHAILVDQFTRLRDADRFWYQRVFSGDRLAELESTRLGDIVRRNSSAGPELPDDVFLGNPEPRSISSLQPASLVALALLILLVAGWARRHWRRPYPS